MMRRNPLQPRNQCAASLAALVAACALMHTRDAGALEYVIEKVALMGEPAPQGGGTYQNFSSGISVNGLGDIGFSAGLSGAAATQGTYVVHADGSAIAILDTSLPPSPPGGNYAYMGTPRLNDAGEFSFSAGLDGVPLGYAWFVQRESGLEMLASAGDPVPTMTGATWDYNTDRVSMLATGDALLGTRINRNPGSGSGLFIIGPSSFDVVVTDGDAMPVAGSPPFTWVASEADANAEADVAFYGESSGMRGVFARKSGTLTALAVEKDPAPFDPTRTFSFASTPQPRLNEAGQIVFFVFLDGPTTFEQGVFIAQPDGTLELVSLEGDPVPGAPERSFVGFGTIPVIDAAGGVIFLGLSRQGSNPVMDGIYAWRDGVLSTVVEEGAVAPESGGATFADFSNWGVDANDSGVVAFFASLDDGRLGIYRAGSAAAPVPLLAPAPLALLTASLAATVACALRRRRDGIRRMQPLVE